MSAPLREVLVTGADTELAAAIAAALARDPAVRRVICAHAKGRALPESSPQLLHVAADLSRARDVRDLLLGESARRIDAVVHVPVPAEVAGRLDGDAPPAAVSAVQEMLLTAEEQPSIQRFVVLSSADVYRIDSSEPLLIDEDHPLELSATAAGSVRERVETDLVACARIGVSRLDVAVLRCSEIMSPGSSGQLHDYLGTRVCLRPLGYDPMLNVLALEDAAEAVRLATLSSARGVFNIPGRDSLPLSELIHLADRIGLALPGPLLQPLYALRAVTTAFRFRYPPERRRFHFGAVLDGSRAQRVLGYAPAHGVDLATLARARRGA